MSIVPRLIVIAAIGLAAIGCSPGPASPEPTVSAVSTPSPADLEAIRFRTEFGLRADLGYVRAVAANPLASSTEFSVPLLPSELAELNARAANVDAIREVVVAYTEQHASDFAGIYIDQRNGGALTTMWTANLGAHAAAIRALIRPGSRVAFRPATFTHRDLQALQDRIVGDWDWMRAMAIAPDGVGIDVIANRVDVNVSSANQAAPAIIIAHYGAPAGMLSVVSDGTGALLIPRGTVRGRVIDALGKPPGDALAHELTLNWRPDGPGTCGHGDVGIGIAGDGTFELPCQAGGHTIDVQTSVADGSRTIASGHVVAVANAIVELEIRLDGPWSSVGSP